ncbi:hypothetical protein M23134_07974 [Microscilla marina ATCC 23134]|uniref:Uncharacterized protein n=1 Tax=Microscilla marina ATCC 23134 TaxID=313606 RepID=A1ZWJ6_MICM2|nr:hypothetical protein M23134_07974 [Microscilla marina ATCC 23134]
MVSAKTLKETKHSIKQQMAFKDLVLYPTIFSPRFVSSQIASS